MQKKYSEIKPGEAFKFGGQNWIRLEEAGLCVMEDILEERAFDEESNDWRKSEIREYLNNFFYERLTDYGAEEKDFLMIETDLTADDGMKDYGTSKDLISLMTADLYRRNRHLLKPLKSWWWLATPHSCIASYSYYVRCVHSSGTLGKHDAYYGTSGVRPLCNLSSETLVFVPGEEEETEEMKNYNEAICLNSLTKQIKYWAVDRNLNNADPKGQMLKLFEEAGELAEGIAKCRLEQIKDSIGDVYVVLTILALQLDLDIKECVEIAYNEIKDRKGRMIDGVYVKEEDLNESN